MRRSFLLCVVLLLAFWGIAQAHHPGMDIGFVQAGPIRTMSASTSPQGKWAFNVQHEYTEFEPFSDQKLLNFAATGNDVHSVDAVSLTALTADYGVTDNLTVSLRLPYLFFDNVRESHAEEPEEIHVHGDSRGMGDLSLLGQYRFFLKSDFEASVIAGLEFPTGRTHARDLEGVLFEAEFQPGSGSWDPLFGLAAQMGLGGFCLYANLLYMVVTEGTQDTDLGDSFSYNAALTYTPYSGKFNWDLVLELNGEYKRKQGTGGVDDPNSGGHTLLLSPGMRIGWNKRLSAFISFGIPVVQNLNGIQNELNYRILTGVAVAF